MKTRTLIALALSLVLAACMLVDDFGPSWDEARADPCVNKIAEPLYAGEFRRDPSDKNIENLARAITKDGQNYLLLKKEEDDKGGRMYRFRVINGIFQRLRIDPAMRSTFEHDYPNAPVDLSRDTITFDQLGDKEWKLLNEISGKDEYWQIEDQILYNTMRNPLCRFEDRDLTKED